MVQLSIVGSVCDRMPSSGAQTERRAEFPRV
jgi:hypothetical protein